MTITDKRAVVDEGFHSDTVRSVDFGGGPPNGGDFAARLLRLEDQHTGIMAALARIETRLDAIDDKLTATNQRIDDTNKRIDQMPDKFWTARMMIWIVVGTFALLLTVNKIFEIIATGF